MITLYLASTLYHSFPQGKGKQILRVFDHSSIFLLIAGTYTPIALIGLNNVLGKVILSIIWGLAFMGIIFKILWIQKFKILSLILYTTMGWLIILLFKPLSRVMNPTGIVFLIVGGVVYSAGIIFYTWKRLKYHHAVWHLFVLGGSICHFITVLSLISNI